MSRTDYQEFLIKTQQNLQILQERKAKYGDNAPLDLLNQIDDHQEALILTEQAINGEIGEDEWQEALQPLHLSLARTTNNFQVFIQSVPKSYAIGVGIALIIILVVGVANLVKTPTPVPQSPVFLKVISGHVLDDITEKIVNSAKIQVKCGSDMGKYEFLIDNGIFQYRTVCDRPAAIAHTTVIADGYWENTTEFELMANSPPDLIKHDFRLTPNTHAVKYGETLAGIGRTYGVSVNAIAQVNSNISQVSAGQVINIPSNTAATPTPPPQDTSFAAELVAFYEGAAIETAIPTDVESSWRHIDPEVNEIVMNVGVFKSTCTIEQCNWILESTESFDLGSNPQGSATISNIFDSLCPDPTTYDPNQVTYGLRFIIEAKKDGVPADPAQSNLVEFVCSPPTSVGTQLPVEIK